LHDGAFFRALKLHAGNPPLQVFLGIAPAVIPQSPFNPLFLRRRFEGYLILQDIQHVASELANALLQPNVDQSAVRLLLEIVQLSPSAPGGPVWLLDWIDSCVSRKVPTETLFKALTTFPSGLFFQALGSSHHTTDSLSRVEKFLKTTFRDHTNLFTRAIPVRNWFSVSRSQDKEPGRPQAV
jgi:hypothetical protein